jgi:threonine dehydratase
MIELPDLAALEEAARCIYEVMPATAQLSWPLLNQRLGAEVWLKHENHTPLGAFKIRGGLVYFADLKRSHPAISGVISATRGNHGQSIAFAAHRHGLSAVVVVPHGNSREKNAAMRALGAELIEYGDDFQDALEHAQRLATSRSLHLVPSYHEALVRGVATYSLELLRAVPDLRTLYVPIGLGSGVSGAVAAKHALGLQTEIVGVAAAAAPAYAESFKARRSIERTVAPTVADGMACRVPNSEALALILARVSRVILVTEEEIQAAMRALFSDTHNIAEGAGAAALAGALQERSLLRGQRVGVVLTGSNVDRSVYSEVLTTAQ